jgi:hypothetical protein
MKYLLLFFCLILCSCEYSEPAGYCHSPIRLSKGKLSFSAEGGIDSIIMGDTFWWLHGSSYRGCKNIGDTDYCNDNYCKNGNQIMKIECSWFSVTQINEHVLIVSVNENNRNEEKNMSVSVEAGNCSSGFSITQSSKSPRNLWFNAKGGIDSINTEGEWHYIINPLMVEDTIITLVSDKKQYCSEIFPFEKNNNVYVCTDEIPFFMSEDSYSRGIVGIEYSWFTVNKSDKKKVIFSVSENKTGKNRKFGVKIEAEDYYTHIWVNQSAE